MPERVTLQAGDGVALEAELANSDGPARAGAVLCHPHPQYGGTMRSIVISALFAALPTAGVSTLRFNFRGVEESGGGFDEGNGERLDAAAAIGELAPQLPAGVPLVLIGWSFGADIALSVRDPSVAAWVAIAPPLHYGTDVQLTTADPRPKLLALAEHDEFRAADEVAALGASWTNTEIAIIGGASHFFVGRTDPLSVLVLAFVDRLVDPGR